MSAITSLFEKITRKQKERERDRQTEFKDLVTRIADNEEPEADEVDAVLRANNKTLNDLEAAVKHLQQRRELRATVDRAEELEKERPKYEKQLATARSAFDEAEAKYEAVANPLRGKLEYIREVILNAESAKRQLQNTCTDPDLLAQQADAEGRRGEASNRHAKLWTAVADLRKTARHSREEAEYTTIKVRQQELRDLAAKCDAKLVEHERELAEADKEVKACEAELDAIRARMLEP